MPRHRDESFEGRRRGERGYGRNADEGHDDRRHEPERQPGMDDRRYEEEPWASRWRGTSGEGEREWPSQREPRGAAPRYIGERGEMSPQPHRRDYGPTEGTRGDVGQSGYWQSESDWRDQGGHGDRSWPQQAEGQDSQQRDARRSGPHVGRGPKGYQRSDERIKEDVCEQLTQHGQIDATDIEIKVSNREVTLTGTVTHRQCKRLAEDIAESVSGVTEVHNQLRVGTSSSGSKPAREGRAA